MFNSSMFYIVQHTFGIHFQSNLDKIGQDMWIGMMNRTDNNLMNSPNNWLISHSKYCTQCRMLHIPNLHCLHSNHQDRLINIQFLSNIYPNKISKLLMKFRNFHMDRYNFHNFPHFHNMYLDIMISKCY